MCGKQTQIGFGIKKANPYRPNKKGTMHILFYLSGTKEGEMNTK